MNTTRAYLPAKHRVIGTLGDINPADYGGGFSLRIYPNGGRDPSYITVEFVEWSSDDDDATGALYSTGEIPADVAKEHDWIDARSVARYVGVDPDQWRNLARSRRIMDRVRCIEDIAGYYGWANLDSYPIVVTRDEIRQRWARFGTGPRR